MTISNPDTASPAEHALEREYFSRFPGEAVRTLEKQPVEEIVRTLSAHRLDDTLGVWERISPDIARQVLLELPDDFVTRILSRLEPNRGGQLVAALDADVTDRYLALLPEGKATELRDVLRYPPDRAGALMDRGVRLFRESMTVRQVLDRLRADRRPSRRGFFVVDADGGLTGWVDMQDIALASRAAQLQELQSPVVASVDAMAGRDEVTETIQQHAVTELPVVDIDGRLLGIIRQAGLMQVERDRASVGIQTMVGVSKDERALSNVSFAVRKRLPWLQINLATAFLAAAVVGLFEQTIAQFTALAVLLPVVAGQSGNTGAQALAVTMRGLALREIRSSHWPRVVLKELNVGLWNGIAVAVTTAVGVFIWSGSYGLTLVIGVSMVLSMVIAGAAGAAIPIILTVAGQDPAQSSSIVLTTITDVAGFFSFLGIATVLASLL